MVNDDDDDDDDDVVSSLLIDDSRPDMAPSSVMALCDKYNSSNVDATDESSNPSMVVNRLDCTSSLRKLTKPDRPDIRSILFLPSHNSSSNVRFNNSTSGIYRIRLAPKSILRNCVRLRIPLIDLILFCAMSCYYIMLNNAQVEV